MRKNFMVLVIIFAFILTLTGCGGGTTVDNNGNPENPGEGENPENPGDVPDKVAAISLSPVAGAYTKDLEITLSTTTDEANIYYTTNGSTPTSSSTLYNGSIVLSGDESSLSIKAIAIKNGMDDSNVTDGNYTITYDSLTPLFGKTAESAPNYFEFKDVAVGDDGAYVVGYVYTDDPFDLGVEIAGDNSVYNAFIAKYDFDGNIIWAKSVASATGSSKFNAIAIGSDGVYAVGFIEGTVANPDIFNFADDAQVDRSDEVGNQLYDGYNAVIVKYDFDGNGIWARSAYKAPATSEFYDVSVSGDNIYAVGYLTGEEEYAFCEGVLACDSTIAARPPVSGTGRYSGKNILIAKYDKTGTSVWAKSLWNGFGDSVFNGVVSNETNIYAVGYLKGQGPFDISNNGLLADTSELSTNKNLVIIKYSTNGICSATKINTGESNSTSEFNGASIGSDGKIYVVGYYSGSINLANSNLSTSSNYNSLITKYDSNLNVLDWGSAISSLNAELRFSSVYADTDSIYAAGHISGSGDFNFGNDVSITGQDTNFSPAIVKYDTNLDASDAKTLYSSNSDTTFYAVFAGDEGIYTAGYGNNEGTIDFGENVADSVAQIGGGITSAMKKGILVKYKK